MPERDLSPDDAALAHILRNLAHREAMADLEITSARRIVLEVIEDRTRENAKAAEHLARAEGEIERLRVRLAAAERRAEEAEVLLIDVMASLAAAISLLERAGKPAKKAAPSDQMFDQMLEDYRASLERARAALRNPQPEEPKP